MYCEKQQTNYIGMPVESLRDMFKLKEMLLLRDYVPCLKLIILISGSWEGLDR